MSETSDGRRSFPLQQERKFEGAEEEESEEEQEEEERERERGRVGWRNKQVAAMAATCTTTVLKKREGFPPKEQEEERNEWGRTAGEEAKRNAALKAAQNDLKAPRREFLFG